MKIYLEGHEPDANDTRFSGSIGSKTAELDDETIDGLDLREALTRFGQALAAQYSRHKTDASGQRVIGVNIRGIEFQFIFSQPEREDA